MKLNLFNYNLPKQLIAQTPASPRDHSRLLVYNKENKKIIHDRFLNLPKYLKHGDVLVFNNSKVFPARLIGRKASGGRAEILLLKRLNSSEWEAMIGARKPKIGLKISFALGLSAEAIERLSDKTWRVKFNFSDSKFNVILDKIGRIPTPPYIAQSQKSKIKSQYQTIYAKIVGSTAAPTAGLHFTKRLLKKIKDKGCQTEFVTLHVGLGTFDPVNTENIEDYKIHKEWISVNKKTVERLRKAKQQKRRIIAVGTTSVRTLETIFAKELLTLTANHSSLTDIFIYPGYKFNFVDAMITNFHLPNSSLLMLVAAFIGRTRILQLYQLAIRLKYRFFSFGDAMFIF